MAYATNAGWSKYDSPNRLEQGLPNYEDLLNSQAARWTIGRVDAIFRAIIGAFFTGLQTGKLIFKTAMFATPFGPFSVDESEAKDELHYLHKVASKTLQAVKDIFLSPDPNYESCFTEAYKYASKICWGVDRDIDGFMHELKKSIKRRKIE